MSTSRLNIQLFHTLSVCLGDNPPLDLGSPKAKSLFAYLILNNQQNIDRRRLAYLFWPRTTEAAARRNLRQYLHRLRRSLEPIDPDGRFLNNAGHNVYFQPPENWYLDVTEFERACTPPHENLIRAVTLYNGDLLEDIYDDWVESERDRLARLYRECLVRLIAQLENGRQYSSAIQYAQQYLSAEPYLENGYVILMRLYYATGNRGGVKQIFEQLQMTFEKELGAEPLPETAVIYQQMLSGDYSKGLASPPLEASHAHPVESAPISTQDSFPLHNQKSKAFPFIGRAEELLWLTSGYAAALNAGGSFYMIQGESGVGKTRLVSEWLEQVETAVLILSGLGHEFESMIPYNPLTQALQKAAPEINWEIFQPPPPWMPALSPILPDWARYAPGYGSPLSVADQQYHVVEGLGNFILTLTRQQPVILYIDNLHWVDAPTWNFLAYMARRADGARLMIIGGARLEDLSHERVRLMRKLQRLGLVHVHTLQRLSQENTYKLVGELMDDPNLEPLFLRRIYEETEGNPFFIVETIQAVREAGGDWTESVPTDASGKRPFFTIPLQIQSVIESRLDKLNDESRAALGVAAAIGREFNFMTLQAVSQYDTETLLNALDEWLGRGLVRETRDGYDFTHEQLSRVAYQQLSRARRQWIHLQIAKFLSGQTAEADPAQLAHHYYLSSEPANALPYLALAGQRALRVRSYAEAREFGLRAIGLLGRYPTFSQGQHTERLDLSLQMAQAYAFTGALPKALQMLQEAERSAEALGDMTRLAQIFIHSARIFWLHGHPANADDYARRALRHAEELDDAEMRLAALRMLGRVNIVLSHYDDSISYLLRYLDLTEKGTPRADVPAVYGYLGVAYSRVGSWQRAIDAAQRGFEQASKELMGAIHMVARMQLAFVYAELREWEQALAIAEPMREQWREEGMTPHVFMLRTVVGRCQAFTRSGSEGASEIQAALQWAEEVEYRVQLHVAYLYLAQAQFQAGAAEVGRGTAVTAAELAAQAGDSWAQAVALRTQAQITMTLPRPDWQQIEEQLVQSMHLLRQIRARPDLARTYLSLRRLYDRAGQTAWAVDCHFRATTIFDELGMKTELGIAQGRPTGERTGAVVIPGLALTGPNLPD